MSKKEILVESFCVEEKEKIVCIEISKGNFKEFLEKEIKYLDFKKEKNEFNFKIRKEDFEKFKKELIDFLDFEKDYYEEEEYYYYERREESFIIIDSKNIIIEEEEFSYNFSY